MGRVTRNPGIHRYSYSALWQGLERVPHSSIDCGFSMNFLKCWSHWAPTAPSTTRWSHDIWDRDRSRTVKELQ